MDNLQKGFSPIFLLIAAILIIGGGAYLYSQGDLPIGASAMKGYSDPQGIYDIKVPSDLSTYASLSPGTNYRMSEKLIAGGTRSEWSTGAEIALVNNSDYDSYWSPTINSAKSTENILIGGTSGYLWSSSFSPGKGAPNLNELAALSGPIPNSNYRLYIVIHNVKDEDINKYSALLKQIATTVSFK